MMNVFVCLCIFMKQFERAMRYLQDYDKKIQDYTSNI